MQRGARSETAALAHGGSELGLAIVKELTERRAAETQPQPPPAGVDEDEAEEQMVAVLVVEVDLVKPMVIEEMLKLLGCEVDVVGDGDGVAA